MEAPEIDHHGSIDEQAEANVQLPASFSNASASRGPRLSGSGTSEVSERTPAGPRLCSASPATLADSARRRAAPLATREERTETPCGRTD